MHVCSLVCSHTQIEEFRYSFLQQCTAAELFCLPWVIFRHNEGGPGLLEIPGLWHGPVELAWVGVRRLAAANCDHAFQPRRGIFRGSAVEMIGL